MPPQGLSLRTTSGSYVTAKSWPLRGTNPARTSWKQSDTIGLAQANQTYDRLYRTQPWVYVCVNKLARAISRLPLKTYSLSAGTGEREEERTAPVAKLLRKPWPTARSYQLIEFAVSTLAIYGNATFVKNRGGNGQTPNELWPLPWPQVEVVHGRDEPIESYRWTGSDGTKKLFMADDVVHLKYYNPDPNEPFGVSPLEALASTLASESLAQRFGINSFANGARPSSFITSERNLTRQGKKELREEIDQMYGGVDNSGRPALLDNGLDWKPLAWSATEMQMIDGRKLSREEVCAVYDIPPPMVGVLDHATYSNIDQQHWMLYMDTLAPICKMIEDTLMAQLVDTELAWDGFFVEFDMDAVLKGNIEQRSQSYQRFLQSGVYTPNELRKFENEPPINDPQANAIYVPVNLEPVSPAMRRLQEQEQQQQMEQQQLQAEQAHQQQLQLATASGAANGGGKPKPPNPNPPGPPPPKRIERRMADFEERLRGAGL